MKQLILTLDIGNTQIVIGVWKEQLLLAQFRVHTDVLKTWEEYAFLLDSFLQRKGLEREAFEGAILSSVVPRLRSVWKQAVEESLGVPCWCVGEEVDTGLVIDMDQPSTVGRDLLVGAVAALQSYEPPLAVFDLGTATTLAILDAQGRYVGGVICPGLQIGLDALAGRTASLPHIELTGPVRCQGKNTVECMRSGMVLGHAAVLDGLLDRTEQELGCTLSAVATGGWTATILPHCRRSIAFRPNLLLEGLLFLYHRHRALSANVQGKAQ